jgi:rhamnosyltransferase
VIDRVVAIVVTYQPDVEALFLLLCSLVPQVAKVVVVDNGSKSDLGLFLEGRFDGQVVLVRLGRNLGIASAQNAGIDLAREFGATHVALFDQDSIPAEDMISELLLALRSLRGSGHLVAAVGPCYIDSRQGEVPVFVRVQGLRLHRVQRDGDDCVSVDHVIASGTLIPIAVLDVVGGMNDSLFIDYVDIEWCLRAKSCGYEIFGCYRAKMNHSLGDDPVVFLGKARPVRSPLRHYYLFRNAIFLYRMPAIPLRWKIADFLQGILRFGFYALFAKPRSKQLAMMLLGIWHGLRGRSGPLPDTL